MPWLPDWPGGRSAAYRHVSSPRWRSEFIWSAQRIDNDDSLTRRLANRSARVSNLIWFPAAGFDVGAELVFGERRIESGQDSELHRLIPFAKYGF